MNKNTIIAGVLVAAAAGAGFYFYKKTKGAAPSAGAVAGKPATGGNALMTAGITLGTSAANDFLSWLSSPSSNTGSSNSTSGTSDDNSGYLDTGLNWL